MSFEMAASLLRFFAAIIFSRTDLALPKIRKETGKEIWYLTFGPLRLPFLHTLLALFRFSNSLALDHRLPLLRGFLPL
jgi:hypothetical protein